MGRFILIIAGMLMMAGVQSQQNKPAISFDKEIHDYGQIKEAEGSVSNRFTFRNTGNQPLVITDVKSSCGCTSPSWTRQPIMPGSTGYVEAVFDPKNRPGNFNKSIVVYSNGEPSPVVLRIKGNVQPRERTLADNYPFKTGGLRLKTNQFGMAKVYYDQIKTESFEVVNVSDEPITMSFQRVPQHITITPKPETLAPGEKGQIDVAYNAKKKNDWDFVYDRVYLLQNGQSSSNNYINISARITENFSDLSEEELANAPKIQFENKTYNFGKAGQQEKIEHEFTFTNTGKSDLVIRKIRASCGCTTVNPSKDVIPPGDSSSIKAIFNIGSRKGRQSKTIFVITNDPNNFRTLLHIKGQVEVTN